MRSVRARSADEAYKKPADARNRRRPAWRPAGVPVSLQVAPACRLFDLNQYFAAVSTLIEKLLSKSGVMGMYQVSFFKYLLSSDGHPFKCLQGRIGVSDAESAEQAKSLRRERSKRSTDVPGSSVQFDRGHRCGPSIGAVALTDEQLSILRRAAALAAVRRPCWRPVGARPTLPTNSERGVPSRIERGARVSFRAMGNFAPERCCGVSRVNSTAPVPPAQRA